VSLICLIHLTESREAVTDNLTRTQFFIAIAPCPFRYRVIDNYVRVLKIRASSVRNCWFGVAIEIITDVLILACSFIIQISTICYLYC